MPFLNAAGVDVHYIERGPAVGDAVYTVVLLHGFPPDHRIMTGCFEPVFENRPGWRRLYLDLPGMGQTIAPETVRSTDDVFALVRRRDRLRAGADREVRWISIGLRCLTDGTLGVYADWKIDYTPTAHLLTSA
ncbi:alpha/beta fold hydrolase [Actinoplanes sp. NPDC051513]|uniref:alpha/beta fold hydrolase n=1 Tax=Actinoplanes sp. NPDC051513 TaxID=3363908 RepID=UPI00379247AD